MHSRCFFLSYFLEGSWVLVEGVQSHRFVSAYVEPSKRDARKDKPLLCMGKWLHYFASVGKNNTDSTEHIFKLEKEPVK